MNGKKYYLHEFFEHQALALQDHLAILCHEAQLSYSELDRLANQHAAYFKKCGVEAGQYVGIFLERSLDVYPVILGLLKLGAAYIPMDPSYPEDRVNYIIEDSSMHVLLTDKKDFTFQCTTLHYPQIKTLICQESDEPLSIDQTHWTPENVCYVIYTSGTTGRPKGVAVTHKNVTHYVYEASQIYQLSPQDRTYQGFSLAFDASVEEIWVTWASGATLVPALDDTLRAGVELGSFMTKHEITCFSCVPTLLSMIEPALPSLRLLILGGEVCTNDLIARWSRPDLRLINTYGPTEATVITTYAECHPQKTVTIGRPLNQYEIFFLDADLNSVPYGEEGELCIAGEAVAKGYVNNPELTAAKFIDHPILNKRIYRTGDLGRWLENGDIQYLGRIDTQVKLRGFRIELEEIESVIRHFEQVSQAIVSVCEITPGTPTLVAYLVVQNESTFDFQALLSYLRSKLAHYMVPQTFEVITNVPMLPSGKVDRKSLPKPSQNRVLINELGTPPRTETEKLIATVFKKFFNAESISTEAHFFYDLGGHSLLAANVISELRSHHACDYLSMRDLYDHPSIEQLARHIEIKKRENIHEKIVTEKYHVSTFKHFICGVGQFFGCLFQYGLQMWPLLGIMLFSEKFNLDKDYFSLKSMAFITLLFLVYPLFSAIFCIGFKWLLLGRVKPGRYKLWGWFYFRWWLVHRVLQLLAPLGLFYGTPLMNVFLRLMGAQVGKNCYIGTTHFANFDHISIGEHTSIGYDTHLLGYELMDGWLTLGRISIGSRCTIGARCMIGVATTINDESQLDHIAMVTPGMSIPKNAFYSGAPAKKSVLPHDLTSLMSKEPAISKYPFLYGLLHYLGSVFSQFIHYIVYIPSIVLIAWLEHQTHSHWVLLFAVPLAAALYLMIYPLTLFTLKKLLCRKIEPGFVLLDSFLFVRLRLFMMMLNVDEINVLADSLFYPAVMKLLGAKIGKKVEMGEAPYILPDLVTMEDESFTASSVGLGWGNVHQGWLHLQPTTMARRSFAGNVSLMPSGSQLGEACLLGCLSAPPHDKRAMKKFTAWLGSPALFLPKREIVSGYTEQDTYYPSKTQYIIRLGIEVVRVILPTTLTILCGFAIFFSMQYSLAHYTLKTTFFFAPLVELVTVLGAVSTVILLKWLILGRLKPTVKPLWDMFPRKIDLVEYSWSYFTNVHLTERLIGTPFIAWLLRCYGAAIGKKNYIGTTEFAEFDLISIGNEVCIDQHTLIDTHLYEDRVFKCSTIQVQDGCNVGAASIILYDTIMEKNATLGHLSLLMKGERLAENTHWQGIPSERIPYVQLVASVVAVAESYPEVNINLEPT